MLCIAAKHLYGTVCMEVQKPYGRVTSFLCFNVQVLASLRIRK